ncbi:MAG: AbrB/MazE/SpoVT family DNA-binding domain-containing protein [Candidatus Aminicenantes bacterium]|jgi:AbrB family looped-hinge helix DNA binding protein
MTEIIQTSLDSQGRIVIPSAIRKRLGLSKGVTLIVEEEENNEIRLRIQKGSPKLVDKKGVLVVKSESKGDLTNTIKQERDRRIIDLMKQAIHEDIT